MVANCLRAGEAEMKIAERCYDGAHQISRLKLGSEHGRSG